METEAEFLLWLNRKECTFGENLQFAINSWQSVEFSYTNKYETILTWLSDVLLHNDNNDEATSSAFPKAQLMTFLELRAQPGLAVMETKKLFINRLLLLKLPKNELPQILYKLLNFEIMQDVYRADQKLLANIYATILQKYEAYLCDGHELSATDETEFFGKIMQQMFDYVKHVQNMPTLAKIWNKKIMTPLVDVVLSLRTHNLDYFDELASLHAQLYEGRNENDVVSALSVLPLHVRLLVLECAMSKRRDNTRFQQCVVQRVFLLGLEECQTHTDVMLLDAAYTLELLRKQNISLLFPMDNERTALAFISERLMDFVRTLKGTNLREVLMLVNAALRLNPLILEEHIYQITVWLLVAPKYNAEEQKLYAEYLVLLLDMFRRLSRTERFIINLLKILKEWLSKYELPDQKPKRTGDGAPPAKRARREHIGEIAPSSVLVSGKLKILFVVLANVPEPASEDTTCHSFPMLKTTWPSDTAGIVFTKLIAGLVTKPALVIWKTLMFALETLLTEHANDSQLNNNTLFNLNFLSAMLSQCLRGLRLAEQAHKYSVELQAERNHTAVVLAKFGRFLLAREHNKCTMNAFLECSYYSCAFELVLAYYMLDGSGQDEEPLMNQRPIMLHRHFSVAEWTLLEQRVLNFGKRSCKQLFYRLQLQRSEGTMLRKQWDESDSVRRNILTSLLGESLAGVNTTVSTLQHISELSRQQKHTVIETQIKDSSVLNHCYINDLETVELLALNTFEQLCVELKNHKAHSMLIRLKCDFHQMRTTKLDDSQVDKFLQPMVTVMNSMLTETPVSLNNLPLTQIGQLLEMLRKWPIAYLRCIIKSTFFLLIVGLLRDLTLAMADIERDICYELLMDFLHFGQHVSICKYIPTANLLELFPVDMCGDFYKFLFNNCIKREDKGAVKFLEELSVLLRKAFTLKAKFNVDQRSLLLNAIETLASMTGASARRMRQQLNAFLTLYGEYVRIYFGRFNVLVDSSKKFEKFVKNTVSGYPIYVSAVLAKACANQEIKESDKDGTCHGMVLDEEFRRITKIYMGNSMHYHNSHNLRLTTIALTHRQQLHFDSDEIEYILSGYWRQLNIDLKTIKKLNPDDQKNIETAIKLIIGNKTNEDFLLMLRDLDKAVQNSNMTQSYENGNQNKTDNETKRVEDDGWVNTLSVLELIGKCPLSAIKGAILNDQYKNISMHIQMRLKRNARGNYIETENLIKLLNCQEALIYNKTVPMSNDTLDNILGFLAGINIKEFQLTDETLKQFNELHATMSNVCVALLKQRSMLLNDRVVNYLQVFKDLIQSIILYKCDRQKDALITENELATLTELVHKLATLTNLVVATQAAAVKRVAPFALMFVIDLMVSNQRLTTSYQQIKLHVERICYDLIGICDHRSGRFILRCCSESGRQLYELLVKEHKKYHKFKGKI